MALKGEFIINQKEKEEVKKEETPPTKPAPESLPPEVVSPETAEPVVHQVHQTGISKRLGPLTSLTEYPQGIFFQNQEPNETIILLVRRDFITNVPWILGLLLLAVVPPLFSLFLPSLLPSLSLAPITQIVILLFYYLILFGFLLINFSIWYFNVGIVTNTRIVDLDVTGILFRHLAETRIDLIQDVSYTQNGSIRSLFDYGDVFLQTAGSLPNFEFDRAPRPAQVVNIIGDLIGKEKEEKNDT